MSVNKRNVSIETLRIVLMFLIVLHHVCLYGSLRHHAQIVGAISTFTHFATDAFVFISGWYGINMTPKRIFRFFGIGLMCAVEVFLLSLPVGINTFRFSFGWFGWAYLALMLVAPIVNYGLEAVAERNGMAGLTNAWGMLTAAFVASWAFGVVPGWGSHTFCTVLYVYITGRYLRLRLPERWVYGKASRWLWLFMGLTAFNFVWAYCGLTIGGWFAGTRGFNAPWIVGSAVSVVFLFLSIKSGSVTNFVGKYLAPSAFSIYLIHYGCNDSVGKAYYLPMQEFLFEIVNEVHGGEVLAVIGTALIVFAVCLSIDLLRRALFSLIHKEDK